MLLLQCDAAELERLGDPSRLENEVGLVVLHEGAGMNDTLQPAPKVNGLTTVLNTVVAPKEAFETIRVTPTWGWAFVIVEILVMIGTIMILPAVRHAFDAAWAAQVATSPQLSQMPADQVERAKSFASAFVSITPVITLIAVPITLLISTLIMLIFNALGRGSGSFQTLWAAATNIAVPASGLGSVVLGTIVAARGAANFSTPTSVQSSMPSLALLAPQAATRITAILAQFNPFTLWAAALVILAMLIIARVPKTQAWLTGITALLLPALFAAAFAH